MTWRTWLVATFLAGVAFAQAPGAGLKERQEMTSLSGRTIRWMFVDGPTAGTTFEHTLDPDGSIVWRAVDGAFKGASRREKLRGGENQRSDVGRVVPGRVRPHAHGRAQLRQPSGHRLRIR